MSEKMRTIWMISKYVAPVSRAKVGARGFLLLREFAKIGHQTVLITSDANHVANTPHLSAAFMDETVDGVHVRWIKTWKYSHPASFKRILSWLHFEWRLWRLRDRALPRPDVVIASSLSLLTILNGIRLRRKFGCKLVFEVRDIWPLLLYEAGRISPYHPLCLFLGAVERMGYRSADLIVGTMPNLGQHVSETIGCTKPVLCIPQGVEEAMLSNTSGLPENYAETYIPKGKFIVCHAGSIGADNALETLFQCASAMRDDLSVHFLIVGDGYLKSHFQEVCEDLPNVTFAPRVDKSAVQAVLAEADLLYFAAHPSPALRFGQSLNKLIDYMAAGKPVLASYTGYPSMLNEADCGLFVPAQDAKALQDAIKELASKPREELLAMGNRGRRWLLENRTYAKLSDAYLQHL